MANDLNERLDAAPEPEMRVAAPAPVTAEPAGTGGPEIRDESPERTPAESSNDSTAPSIRLVDNKDFKVFSYGGDEPQPGLRKNSEPHISQEQEAINAIRRDITLIANGATQISANKNLVGRQAGNDDAHTSVRGQQELNRQLAEQRRIEAWNNTQTNFGGVMMTNGQALATIHGINKDADKWADRAIARGDINEDDREKFKEKLRRLEELQKLEQEKAAKGETLSAGETKEKSEILSAREVSRTIEDSTQNKDFANNASLQTELSRTGTSASYSKTDSGINAPAMKQDFIAASTAQTPAAQAPKQQVAEQVQKNNLSVPGLS